MAANKLGWGDYYCYKIPDYPENLHAYILCTHVWEEGMTVCVCVGAWVGWSVCRHLSLWVWEEVQINASSTYIDQDSGQL